MLHWLFSNLNFTLSRNIIYFLYFSPSNQIAVTQLITSRCMMVTRLQTQCWRNCAVSGLWRGCVHHKMLSCWIWSLVMKGIEGSYSIIKVRRYYMSSYCPKLCTVIHSKKIEIFTWSLDSISFQGYYRIIVWSLHYVLTTIKPQISKKGVWALKSLSICKKKSSYSI